MNKSPRKKKEISIEELKVLQMDILEAIDEFCDEHSIRYSMACGTFLGAIRHKGYIPWDDDIDIYVPREDYSRLLKEFPTIYKGRYKITSLDRNSKWARTYAKAYDYYTRWEENSAIKEELGVNIDIFPVDDVPFGENWTQYDKIRRRILGLFSLKFVRISSSRSFIKNFGLSLFKMASICFPARLWAKCINRSIQHFNDRGYDYCFECCLGLLQKRPFKKALFDNLQYYQFEDRFFKGFSEYDEYLRNAYGNYMQLPPEEKRVSHHSFVAFWK